ncbi:hypothetical protein BC827DRAFT_1172544 [Russula dissimulans]|nr:hypothetical protein BC827DRAFT_1172544 [Russula dissimulans]
MGAHLDKVSFCKYCSDLFARSDSLTRRYDSRPPERRNVSPVKAEMKRRETERTNEDIGKRFAQIIKEIRQQNRLKEARSRR